MTINDVPHLIGELSIWEIIGYVGAALVLVGVIGELFETASSSRNKKLERICVSILAVGLVVEMLAQIRASALNGKITAILLETLKFSLAH